MIANAVTCVQTARKKILVVDDEINIVQSLRYNLEQRDYVVFTAGDGHTAIALTNREHPDLIVLDHMLPILDGMETCRQLRKISSAPIIILTAKDTETDKMLAFEFGADDYVQKPFSLAELTARIKAGLRRQHIIIDQHASEALRFGDIAIDPTRQQLVVRGNEIELAPKEFRLLLLLMQNRGRIVTRQMLLEKIWGYDFEGESQTLSVHIRWLREKVEREPSKPEHIITIRTRGYLFKAD